MFVPLLLVLLMWLILWKTKTLISFGLTETWLSDESQPNFLNLLPINGYHFFRRDRKGKGGGIAVYLKDNIKAEVLKINIAPKSNIEHLWIRFKVYNINVICGIVYRAPHRKKRPSRISDFMGDLDEILSLLAPTADLFVCMGDFNINLLNVNNPLDKCFSAYNFTQLINEPTRFKKKSATLLDPIFVNCDSSLVSESGTLNADAISDHRLVFCNIKIKKPRFAPKMIEYRDYKNFEAATFLNDLAELDWEQFIQETDIDSKVNMFNSFINKIFDKHAPIRKARVTRPPAPWLTQQIKNLMIARDRALKQFKSSKNEVDWFEYTRLRNITLSSIRKEKKNQLYQISKHNDFRSTWKALNNLHVVNKPKQNLPSELSDPENINKYFSSFLRSNDSPCLDRIKFYSNNKHINAEDFEFSMVTIEDIRDILSNIKTQAVGADGLSIKMLDYCSPFIDKYICHLINICIERSYFPEQWKHAIGCAIPKISNPESFSDLRVISILPVLSKILEKVLHKQIYEYFCLHNFIPSFQAGFRKGFSTATALTRMTDDITVCLDNKLVTCVVLLDYSKAFDTINHRLLLAKLKYYGLSEAAVTLIRSFLTNRKQRIKANCQFSSFLNISAGVPQGSIIGPLLFIIYTADILLAPKYCKTQAYADDTQLYYSFPADRVQEAQVCINSDLQLLSKLSEEHNLKLNSGKSKVMIFATKKQYVSIKPNLTIQIQNENLPIVKTAKNLGIVFDDALSFEAHVNSLFKKAYFSLKLLYASRQFLTRKLKKILVESLVLSLMNYCDFIYGPFLNSITKNRIQVLQNNCCRFVVGYRKFDHISHKVRELGWMDMESRRKLHFGCFLFNSLTSKNMPWLSDKLIPRGKIHNVNIRHKHKLTMPRYETAVFKKGFTFNAVTFINSLPFDMATINNVLSFKKKVRTMIQERSQTS